MSRSIFTFRMPDGSTRFADPLVLEWRLTEALGGQVDEMVARAQIPTDQEGKPLPEEPPHLLARHDAEKQLSRACLFAFELPEFSPQTGEGFTADQALRLLWAWFDWVEAAKKNSAGQPSGATGSPESPKTS